MFNQTADGKGEPYIHQIRGADNLIGSPFEILSDKAVKYYEKLKDKGENVYIDSLTYEQFMMLGDAELSRRFSMQDEAEQKVKIDREQANELEYTKIYRIMDIHMLPITGVHHKSPMNFSQEICNYTEKGRKKIHNNQRAVENSKLKAFQMILNDEDTIEFRNNMVSKFVAQYGKCYITGNELEPENAVGIRIKPKERNGTDDYNNIVIVSKAVIPLIEDIDADYCSNLSEKQKVKLNRLRRARKLKPVKGTCKLA